MARIVKQHTRPPYLLIIMTFLCLVATAIAVKERAGREKVTAATAEARKLTEALVNSDELRSGRVRQMLERHGTPPRGRRPRTVVGQLDEQIGRLTRAITFKATSPEQALVAAREATAGPDGAPRRGLVAEVSMLKQQLARLVGPDGQERTGVVKELKDRVRNLHKQIATRDAQLKVLDDRLRSQIAALERLLQERDREIHVEHAEHLRLQKDTRDRADRRVADLNGRIESHEARIKQEEGKSRDQDMLIGKLRRDVAFYKDLAKRSKDDRIRNEKIARKIVPDGAVMSDPDRSGYCHIDIGAADRVRVGSLFAVYEASEVSGMAKRKGTLVVTRVLPDISECRITSDAGGEVYSVARGDLVANVAFDKRFTQRFVVAGLFDLHGTGRETPAGAETVRKIIRGHGGKIVEKVTFEVDYVVLGVQPPVPAPLDTDEPRQVHQARREAGKAAERYQAIRARAVELRIPVLNTNRFVRDIGYAKERRLVYTD